MTGVVQLTCEMQPPRPSVINCQATYIDKLIISLHLSSFQIWSSIFTRVLTFSLQHPENLPQRAFRSSCLNKQSSVCLQIKRGLLPALMEGHLGAVTRPRHPPRGIPTGASALSSLLRKEPGRRRTLRELSPCRHAAVCPQADVLQLRLRPCKGVSRQHAGSRSLTGRITF